MKKLLAFVLLAMGIALVCISADASNSGQFLTEQSTTMNQDGPFWMLVTGLLLGGFGATAVWRFWGNSESEGDFAEEGQF